MLTELNKNLWFLLTGTALTLLISQSVWAQDDLDVEVKGAVTNIGAAGVGESTAHPNHWVH